MLCPIGVKAFLKDGGHRHAAHAGGASNRSLGEAFKVQFLDGCLFGEDSAPLRAICVVGRGRWIRSHDEQWIEWAQDEPAEELIGLIVSIMNSYRSIAAARKQPLLGLYLY